jgi:protein-tyrosine phosphatase
VNRLSGFEGRLRTALQRQAKTLGMNLGRLAVLAHAGDGISRMDLTWITGRVALGGGIWTAEHMSEISRAGITHIIDMQIEFDDTPLAEPFGIHVLWNPTDDDFQPKEPDLFQRGVEFALQALEREDAKVFIHCAAGVHRAAMMTLALLCSQGWELEEAMQTISSRRPIVDFAEVYISSVERFLQQQVKAAD